MNTLDNARIGKIASLPAAVREEINLRLLNGEPAPQILPWLNGLPAVIRIMAERFRGQPVLRQNLSHWRAGGYREWLRARGHAADTSKLVDQMVKQAETRGETLLESVSTLLAGQLSTVLSQMAELFGSSECAHLRQGFGGQGVRSAELGETLNLEHRTSNFERQAARLTSPNAAQGESRTGPEGQTSNIQHRTSKAEIMGNGGGDDGERTVVDGVVIESGGREDGGSRMERGDGNRGEDQTSNTQHRTSKAESVGEERPSNAAQGESRGNGDGAHGVTRPTPEGSKDEAEAKMALMERRLGLISKATACVARLRKVDQAQATLALNRERLAVAVEANQIKREKLDLMRGTRAQEKKPESAQKADKDALPTGIHEWTDEERRRLEKTVGLGFGPEMPGETPWEDVKPFDLTPDQKRRLDEAKRRL